MLIDTGFRLSRRPINCRFCMSITSRSGHPFNREPIQENTPALAAALGTVALRVPPSTNKLHHWAWEGGPPCCLSLPSRNRRAFRRAGMRDLTRD